MELLITKAFASRCAAAAILVIARRTVPDDS